MDFIKGLVLGIILGIIGIILVIKNNKSKASKVSENL